MGVAVKEKKHFTVAINWAERSLEQWLEQYGSWLLLDNNYEVSLGAKSILGNLIDRENGVAIDGRHRVPPQCKINDTQAKAVEDMLLDMQNSETNKVKTWIKAVTMFYVDFESEQSAARKLKVSEYSVGRDKMLGLVRISTKFKLRSRLTG